MSARYWVEFALNNFTAWYLTSLIYSTVALGGTFLLARGERLDPRTENRLWRGALIAGPLIAAVRIGVEHLDVVAFSAGPGLLTVAGPVGWTLVATVVAALLTSAVLAALVLRAALRERSELTGRLPVHEPTVLDIFQELLREAGGGVPRLTETGKLQTPVAIGRSEICLPAGLSRQLDRDAVRAVLAHEITHLRRSDARWATLAEFLERVFFVQPLYRLGQRRLRETAEFIADRNAVRHTHDPLHLVSALHWFATSGRTGLLVTDFAPGSLLIRRVQRVLRDPSSRVRSGWFAAGLALCVAFAMWFGPAVVPACDCRWPF